MEEACSSSGEQSRKRTHGKGDEEADGRNQQVLDNEIMVRSLAEIFPHLPLSLLSKRCREFGDLETTVQHLLTEGDQGVKEEGQDWAEKRTRKEGQEVEEERPMAMDKGKKALDKWKKECQEQLEMLFPLTCPDYLGKRLAGLVQW